MSDSNIGKSRNYDNVFLRNCIISLLSVLDSKIVIEYKFENNKRKVIPIPFYYGLHNASFNNDAFVDDIPNEFRFSEHNISKPPVGYISLRSVVINSDQFTNPNVYIPFTFYNEDTYETESFIEPIKLLPYTLSFDVGVSLNSENDILKFITAKDDVLFSFKQISFDYHGINIPVQVELPDDNEFVINRDNNGILEAKNTNIEVKFNINMQVTYPSFSKPYINNDNPEYTNRVQWYNTILGYKNNK